MILVTVRDNVIIWNLATGSPMHGMDPLQVRQLVRACGIPISSDTLGMRFDPEDDQLVTKEEVSQKFAGQSKASKSDDYWNDECEARIMVPISDHGAAVEWDNLRFQDEDNSVATVLEVSAPRIRRHRSWLSPWQRFQDVTHTIPGDNQIG